MKKWENYVRIAELGGTIRDLRTRKGITQMDIARECNVCLSMVQRWDKGITIRVTKEHFEQLKRLLIDE